MLRFIYSLALLLPVSAFAELPAEVSTEISTLKGDVLVFATAMLGVWLTIIAYNYWKKVR